MDMNLDEALKQTLCDADLPARLEDLGEFALDSAMSEGALRDLPVIGCLIGATKTGFAIRDYFFMRKLVKFLVDLAGVPIEDRLALARRLEFDAAFERRAGVALIALIDRLDDDTKTRLVARALAAYARNQVDILQLRRMIYAIERLLLPDLPALQGGHGDNGVVVYNCEVPALQSFIAAGLLYVSSGFGVGGVRPTETMDLMTKFVFDDQVPTGNSRAST